MEKNELKSGRQDSEKGGATTLTRISLVARSRVLLIAYGFLLIGTGYIAFFQPQYNPATDIDESLLELIADENTRELTLESLREEGIAFKARRELAVQSFNVVLGAALGFLSALATQFVQGQGASLAPPPEMPPPETAPRE